MKENIMKNVEPTELKNDDFILDVRSNEEHEELSLAHPHWLVELSQLNAKEFIQEHKLDGHKTLNILCRSGRRAVAAAELFEQAGFDNVAVIVGGIMNAETSGLPVVKK